MVTCPWCATTARHFRWSTKDADGLWVYVCSSCGHEFRHLEPLVVE